MRQPASTHWKKIAIAACEQCGRNRIPEVLPLVDVCHYRPVGDGTRLLLSARRRFDQGGENGERVRRSRPGRKRDSAPRRKRRSRARRFRAGEPRARVLRTETAALAALAALNALRGDF